MEQTLLTVRCYPVAAARGSFEPLPHQKIIRMYLPEPFKIVDGPEIEAFLQRYDFATMVSPTPEALLATHVPVVVRREASGLVVLGHVARANAHWKNMDGRVESLAIFHGPHSYISPTWYANSPAVPTWNYAVVHVYGRPLARHDPAFVEDVLKDLLEVRDHVFRRVVVRVLVHRRKMPCQIPSIPGIFASLA